MRANDPDLARHMSRQVASSMELFGQKIEWRRYVSASGGYPEYGIGDSATQQFRPAQWMLEPLTIEEIQMAGGQEYNGGIKVMTLEPFGQRDEMRYENRIYRCAAQPVQSYVGSNLYWRGVFVLAQVTGQF